LKYVHISDLTFSNLTSGLLQALIFALKETDLQLNQELISKLLDDCFIIRKKAQDQIENSEHK